METMCAASAYQRQRGGILKKIAYLAIAEKHGARHQRKHHGAAPCIISGSSNNGEKNQSRLALCFTVERKLAK
jgi:hypothetical protein